MRFVMGTAVVALRERMHWTQKRLAGKIDKISRRKPGEPVTHVQRISRWERHLDAPSPSHRLALAKLAEKHGHPDLAAIFRAGPRVALLLAPNFPATGGDEEHAHTHRHADPGRDGSQDGRGEGGMEKSLYVYREEKTSSSS